MRMLLCRNPQLTRSEVDEFFADHLPYRLYMLRAHRDRQVKGTLDSEQMDAMVCMFEAGLIASRVLLQFLGLGVTYLPACKLIEQRGYISYDGVSTQEVKVEDLGGSFVEVSKLKPNDAQLLSQIFDGASKSSAHLTYRATVFDWHDFHTSVGLVEELVRTHLYDRVGRR